MDIAFILCVLLFANQSVCLLSHPSKKNVASPMIKRPLPVSNWVEWCTIQYIPRNMHTVFALLCFVVVIHWLIFPYPSGLLHWHCGNLTIAPVPAKQPWWIWINTSCGFIMNDCITTTKQSTTKPCAYFLGYTVSWNKSQMAMKWPCSAYLTYSPALKCHDGHRSGLRVNVPELTKLNILPIPLNLEFYVKL